MQILKIIERLKDDPDITEEKLHNTARKIVEDNDNIHYIADNIHKTTEQLEVSIDSIRQAIRFFQDVYKYSNTAIRRSKQRQAIS